MSQYQLEPRSYSEQWLSVFELFTSASGMKLRINIPDTAIFREGRLMGWFHTSRDGAVARVSSHELTTTGMYQKFISGQTVDPAVNPFGYVAIAHFESGISRPLKKDELQQVVSNLVGPFDGNAPEDDCPFCLQSYIVPMNNMRYIATFGGPEGAVCTSFARRYNLRYTHSNDDPSKLAIMNNTAPEAGLHHKTTPTGPNETFVLSAEEMLVESQLIAMGIISPRGSTREREQVSAAAIMAGSMGPSHLQAEANTDESLPVPRTVKAELQRNLQLLASYIERAHGLRMQGIVSEFIQVSKSTLVLIGINAVQWDSRSSRGRLGTFTDRWADFVAGTGPAPAVRPPSKKHHSPSLLRKSADPTLFPSHSSPSTPAGSVMARRKNPFSSMMLSSPSPPYPLGGDQASEAPPPTAAQELLYLDECRPGSAPTVVMQRFGMSPGASPLAAGSAAAMQSPAAAAKQRAGSAPAPPHQSAMNSYTLWTPRDALTVESVAGSIALELELYKERLAYQTEVAARAEADLTQLAQMSHDAENSLAHQVSVLQQELDNARKSRKETVSEYERLHKERVALKQQLAGLQEEVKTLHGSLETDRTTLSASIRSSQMRESKLEENITRLRQENNAKSEQLSMLQRRVEEEAEVIDAVRSQLFDYRQMVTMLQGQLRRGKGKQGNGVGNQAMGHNAMVADL